MSESVQAIRLATFKDSRASFLSALEDAGIDTGEVKLFSERPQAAGFVDMIYAVSEALPWNALSRVIVAWLEARKSREILVMQGANTVVHARGYSVEDLRKMALVTWFEPIIRSGRTVREAARASHFVGFSA